MLENIDIDSWGKSKKPKKPEKDKIVKTVKAIPKPIKKPRSKPKPRKQITALDLGNKIKNSSLGITGEKAMKRFILRHRKIDVASLTYILMLIRELKDENYEI